MTAHEFMATCYPFPPLHLPYMDRVAPRSLGGPSPAARPLVKRMCDKASPIGEALAAAGGGKRKLGKKPMTPMVLGSDDDDVRAHPQPPTHSIYSTRPTQRRLGVTSHPNLPITHTAPSIPPAPHASHGRVR